MNEELINRLARGYEISPQTIRGLSIYKARLLLKLILMKRKGLQFHELHNNYKTWLRDQEEKALSPKRRIKNHKL